MRQGSDISLSIGKDCTDRQAVEIRVVVVAAMPGQGRLCFFGVGARIGWPGTVSAHGAPSRGRDTGRGGIERGSGAIKRAEITQSIPKSGGSNIRDAGFKEIGV